MAPNRRVFYIFDKNLKDATDNVRIIKCRSAAVHSLIKSYKLLDKCTVTAIEPASEEDLLTFHSSTYIEYLKKAQASKDLEKITDDEETSDFNLEYDCPLFENILDYAFIVAGATLSAARILCPEAAPIETIPISEHTSSKSYLRYQDKPTVLSNINAYDMPCDLSFDENTMLEEATPPIRQLHRKAPAQPHEFNKENCSVSTYQQKVVVNWFGGWHHAQRDAAEGFCYVNDIVIGIQHLRKLYKRVLYVDLDVHHGNGVENAFAHTTHVMTVSFHKYDIGYYPGSGSANDVGIGNGRYYAVNVPLKDGITDGMYIEIFTKVMNSVKKVYEPDCIVVQCGSDCLAGDPLGGFNLSLRGIGFCVQYLLGWNLPTMLLGGGGYNIANAARCYAYLTALVLNEKISKDIPENDFFHLYGPGFELDVSPSLRKNENTVDYVRGVVDSIQANLANLLRS